MRGLPHWALIGIAVTAWTAVPLIWLLLAFVPYDDTDPPGKRSGMTLYTDNRTGCQYLKGGAFGGITPRLDRGGKQICEQQQQ